MGDRAYGGRTVYANELAGRERQHDEKPLIERAALHAEHIAFDHPTTGKRTEIEAPWPADISRLVEALREADEPPAAD